MRNVSRFGAVVMFFATACAPALTCAVGCGPAKHAGDVVIDCTKASQSQIQSLLLELLPMIMGQSPNWAAVKDKAVDAGTTIGGCALAILVQDYLAPPKGTAAPSENNGRAARTTFEEFRLEYAASATYRTKYGDL